MTKKKSTKTIAFILTIIMLITAVSALLTGCAGNTDTGTVVYEDMKDAFAQKNLLSANIGIFSKTEDGDSVSYGECGSGIVFNRDGNDYYALTAAHVVSVQGAQLLVFTVNTEMKTDTIPGIDYNVLSQDTYNAMYPAQALYISARNDLAVIRFRAEEDLSVVEIAEADPAKDDRIMCIGNPESEWFAVSYGRVTSSTTERFGESKGFPSYVMRHSAYIQVGSSGGAAIGEDMKLIGLTPGAAMSPGGKRFLFGLLIPVSEIRLCLDEWNAGPSNT